MANMYVLKWPRGAVRFGVNIVIRRMINRRILFELLKRCEQLFRPLIDCVCVFVERYACFRILMGVCSALRLILSGILNELLREAEEEADHALSAECDPRLGSW